MVTINQSTSASKTTTQTSSKTTAQTTTTAKTSTSALTSTSTQTSNSDTKTTTTGSGVTLGSIFDADVDSNGLNKDELQSLNDKLTTNGQVATVAGLINNFDKLDETDGKKDGVIDRSVFSEMANFDEDDDKNQITTEDLSIYLAGKDVKDALQDLLSLSGGGGGGDGSGAVVGTDLREALNKAVKASNENFKKAAISMDDIAKADTNGDQFVTKEEFEAYFGNKAECAELKTDVELYFDSLDANDGTKDGKIALSTFKKLSSLGDNKDNQENIDKSDLVALGNKEKDSTI